MTGTFSSVAFCCLGDGIEEHKHRRFRPLPHDSGNDRGGGHEQLDTDFPFLEQFLYCLATEMVATDQHGHDINGGLKWGRQACVAAHKTGGEQQSRKSRRNDLGIPPGARHGGRCIDCARGASHHSPSAA